MLPSIQIRQYVDAAGVSPFDQWFERLNDVAAARVTTSLARLSAGNWSNVKGVGGGVFEITLDFGPGYRVYLGKDGDRIVILLGGGTKKRQSRDIEIARDHWKRYRQRKS